MGLARADVFPYALLLTFCFEILLINRLSGAFLIVFLAASNAFSEELEFRVIVLSGIVLSQHVVILMCDVFGHSNAICPQ